jgi:MscS family membrane protein
MKRIQTILFRCYIGVLCGILAWCVLSYSQETNTATTVRTETTGGQPTVVNVVVSDTPPALSFGLHKVEELNRVWLGIPAWQYIASLIYVVLAFIVAKIFDWIVTVQLRKVAAKTRWKLDDMLVELLHGPVRMLVLVVLLQAGLDLYRWPGPVEKWLKNGLKVLLACSLTYALLKLVDLAARYWRSRSTHADKAFNDLFFPMLSKVAKAFIVIMAVLVMLDNLGFNIRTLLAGVSIGGLALGLAAQDTVGNLFGAASVFIDKPFKIGDFVNSNGVSGSVEEIGLRSTRLRNPDGHLITVPNKTMGNSTITNVTRRPNIKTTLNIGVTYDTPADKVQRAADILKEVYQTEMTHDLIIGFNTFGDSALNIQVIHWWKGLDFKEYVAGMHKMNLEVKRRFDQEGIAFAFPSRTVYLRQEGDWRVQLPEGEDGREAQGES